MNAPILALSVTLALFGCSHLSPVKYRVPNNERCEFRPETPPLFNILENSSSQVVVEFGAFTDFFGLSSGNYKYKIMFGGKLIQAEQVSSDRHRITVPVTDTGVLEFSLFQKESNPFWKQKVFVVAKKDQLISAEEKRQLAEMYAPVVYFHDDEKYFPVSLEYLMNEVETDGQLANEPFRITNKKVASGLFGFFGSKPAELDVTFKFSEARKVLPYYGHSESVLKSGLSDDTKTALKRRFGQNHITVYYSTFENPKYNELYINYHFLYTFDSKNSTADKDAMAAHIFDRESMTVVLRSTTKKPLYTFYGAHLASQKMAQLNSKGQVLQSWDSGRVFVNWPEMIKIGDRPVGFAAQGSHGMYPKKATYAVMLNDGKIKLLVEPAGGDRVLYPEALRAMATTPKSHVYALKDLQLEAVTSHCENATNVLAYSGSTVDVLGPTNATFPPFTDREADYKNYLDPNAPLFDMKLE